MRTRPRLAGTLIALFWVFVIGGLTGPLSGQLQDVQENDNSAFLPASAESTRALEVEAGFGDEDLAPAIVLYEREGGLTPADLALAEQDRAAFAQLETLRGEVSPVVPSEDGEAATVVVPLDGADLEGLPLDVEQMRERLDRPDGPDAYVTGLGGLFADFFEVFSNIDGVLLLATAGIVVVILLVVYRSPVLWFLPLLSAGLAYTAAAGVVYVLADNDVLTLNGQSAGILTVLVFGAGTDYALLLIARYREELHAHERPVDAMRVALRGAVPAIVASGATVVLGLLCLLFSDLNSNKSLGPVCAIGIVAAVLAMTTLLPALLVVVGRGVFWPRIPRADGAGALEHGLWDRVAGTVGRRSRPLAAGVTAVLAVFALLSFGLDAKGIAQNESFTQEVESLDGQEALARHFPAGQSQPVTVLPLASSLDPVLEVVRADDDVVVAEVVTDPGGAPRVVDGRVLVNATLDVGGDGVEVQRIVERLREEVDAVPEADALVGGQAAITLDVQTASQRDNRVIIPLVLLVILVVLGLLLRAVVAPLLLIGTVVLSFFATLGVCALVFENVFDFPGADSAFPLFAFIFLVALGIDYNIFLMTRVREETLKSGTRAGTLKGLAVTGGVITSAGIVLAATFAVLGVLPLVFFAQLGFAVAFGILLDTVIVRSLLVPALVLELGDRTWLPGRPAPVAEVEQERVGSAAP